MRKRAIERFEEELARWVKAYNDAQPHKADAAVILAHLKSRIGKDRLRRIGAALANGWLATESGPGRGYFVRESDLQGPGGGQFTLIHRGQGKVSPCWELFVQLSDYAWLRAIAERHGHVVRLEDHLMDLTARCGDDLLLYVEQKVAGRDADLLVKRMRSYGERGVDLDAPDQGNDPLRKAKYLVREGARPQYFATSTLDHSRLFSVAYRDGNRFELTEDSRPVSSPIAERPCAKGVAPSARSPVDPLAIEIEALCPQIWISLGSGRTAYNFYLPGKEGDAILLGVYESGEIWTDVKGLGSERAEALARELTDLGISLHSERDWCFWRRDGRKLRLGEDVNPVQIAQALFRSIR